jgi:NAD(P)-dependent dehydrogenase (short-subunit alcohol dehydrogenase family)
MSAAVEAKFGHVDVLVNNAGISKRDSILDSDDEEWLHVIKVNLFGAYLCIKAILPLIQTKGAGSIINIASTAAKDPKPFNTSYSASKHGLLGLNKTVAAEVAMSGYPQIRVNAICPFYVRTEIYDYYLDREAKRTGLSREEVAEKTKSLSLQHRILEPEEINALAVFLASDAAQGINGQAINICGGKLFH